MNKLDVELGKSDGQKAKDHADANKYAADSIYEYGGKAPKGGSNTKVGYKHKYGLSDGEYSKTRTKAKDSGSLTERTFGKLDTEGLKDAVNSKQADRMRAKAKAGKQQAKKALNMSEVSDTRLDQILAATGEKQDRAARKAGKLR